MADLTTILLSISSSLGVTATGAWLLSNKLIDYRLNRAMEEKKAGIKKQLESELGEQAALRDYEYAAKRRLYENIGPLRFQLLSACADLAYHIKSLGARDESQFSIDLDSYYGKSTLYRILLPLTIAFIIERQIGIADFSVDQDAVLLLKFKRAAYNCLTSSYSIIDHPNANWNTEEQHLFHHNLSKMIGWMVQEEDDGARPKFFNEFEETVLDADELRTVSAIFKNFTVKDKPIFWIRLIGLASVCADMINRAGTKIGFKSRNVEERKLICMSQDPYFSEHIEELVTAMQGNLSRDL